MGEADRDPVPPLNLLGDFGAGGMMLAYVIVCALLKARQSGIGDVVDAAICDGTAALMAPIYAQLAKGCGKTSVSPIGWTAARPITACTNVPMENGCRSRRWSRNSLRCS